MAVAEVAGNRGELESLRSLVEELRREVGDLTENTELDQAKAEIRQMNAERFGRKTEKHSASDRTNRLDDPKEQKAPQKQRGR